MKRKLLKIAITAAIAVVGITTDPAIAADKVRFAQPSDGFLYLPIYVAREKGYFADEGIDADVTVFKGGAASLSAVLSDSAEVYIGVPAIGMRAIAQGQQVRIFSSIMTEYASNIVIQGDIAEKLGLTEESSIDDRLDALKGLTMAITGPGAAPDLLFRHIAKSKGWDPDKDFQLSPVGGGANMLAAFSQKRVDGFSLSSPTSTVGVVEHGGFPLVNLSAGEYEPLSGFLYITLIAKLDWLEANEDLATRVTRAIWRGQKLLAEDPMVARESVRTFFKSTDTEVFNSAWEENLPAFPATPRVNGDAIQRNLDFMTEMQGEDLGLDAESTFTNKYVDAAEKNM